MISSAQVPLRRQSSASAAEISAARKPTPYTPSAAAYPASGLGGVCA